MDSRELTAELPVAEAGRVIMVGEFATILEQENVIKTEATVTAVHEMRKAIRRTFTSFKLFKPYFDPPVLKQYRRGFRKMMSRLGRSRDLAVFRIKLDAFNEQVDSPLDDLSAYWLVQQEHADRLVQSYLAKPGPQEILGSYCEFTSTPGLGVKPIEDLWEPAHIGQMIPVMIFERVATVRAFEDQLQKAKLAELHQLRIQFKELRYTLQFFEPLLGPEIKPALTHLKKIQDHLGDLNDASVALGLLDEVDGLETSVSEYRMYQHEEIERLVNTFLPVWEEFNQPAWRHNLVLAVADL